MYYYARALNAKFAAMVVAYVSFVVVLFGVAGPKLVTDDVMNALQTATIPIFASSKVPQIWTSFRVGAAPELVPCLIDD